MTPQIEPVLRRLAPEDAVALCRFYNELSEGSKRLFRPLGLKTDEDRCRRLGEENLPGTDTKYDVVAVLGSRIVGWAFLWNDEKEPVQAILGIGVADGMRGRGLGRMLMDEVMHPPPGRGLRRIKLTVVRENVPARRMYERRGFVRTGSLVGDDGLEYHSMVKELQE